MLAWTSGDLPFLWFAIVPDAAMLEITKHPGASIVFHRATAGANAFHHTPSAKSFADPRHLPFTMHMLARFLLPSQPLAALDKAKVTDDATLRAFSDQIQPETPRTPKGVIAPAKPMPYASQYPTPFRACGFEAALAGTGAAHVLFFPLAAGGAGYPGTAQPGLESVVESALLCLWNQCAWARDIPSKEQKNGGKSTFETPRPDLAKRPLWVAGHSGGNFSMGGALAKNALVIERALSFATNQEKDNVGNVIDNFRRAAEKRKAANLAFDGFVVSAPDLTNRYDKTTTTTGGKTFVTARGVSMSVEYAKRFIDTGAQITFLPAFAAQLDHFTIVARQARAGRRHQAAARQRRRSARLQTDEGRARAGRPRCDAAGLRHDAAALALLLHGAP